MDISCWHTTIRWSNLIEKGKDDREQGGSFVYPWQYCDVSVTWLYISRWDITWANSEHPRSTWWLQMPRCLSGIWASAIIMLTWDGQHDGCRCPGARLAPGPWFNIKMSSYQYRKSHCGDKTVVRSSYLHSGIFYTGKVASLYRFSPQGICNHHADFTIV